jgi:hypothetical protein
VSARRKFWIIAAVVGVLCAPIAAWYIAGLVTGARVSRALAACSTFRFRWSGLEWEFQKGDPGFTAVLKEVRRALAWRHTWRPTSKARGDFIFYDEAGEIIATGRLYCPRVLLVGNRMYDFDDRWAPSYISEMAAKRDREYPNGQPRWSGSYDRGGRRGTWTYYYESGAVRSRGDFDHARKVGKWTYWDQEGKVTSEKYYLDDREVSEAEYRAAVTKREQ